MKYVALLVCLFTGFAFASPCPASGTFNDFVAFGATGCELPFGTIHNLGGILSVPDSAISLTINGSEFDFSSSVPVPLSVFMFIQWTADFSDPLTATLSDPNGLVPTTFLTQVGVHPYSINVIPIVTPEPSLLWLSGSIPFILRRRFLSSRR